MQWFMTELGIERNGLLDGTFYVVFSPKEGVQPRVLLQTQDPRYDQYQTEESTLVTPEEVMRTISMGILRDARRAERPARR
ncbi:MAG: hypothetical protein K2Z81_15160, partial [Cyanobacteria bacterium]|nr:hypothetical protein [Cyanobacteriota bacterium]